MQGCPWLSYGQRWLLHHEPAWPWSDHTISCSSRYCTAAFPGVCITPRPVNLCLRIFIHAEICPWDSTSDSRSGSIWNCFLQPAGCASSLPWLWIDVLVSVCLNRGEYSPKSSVISERFLNVSSQKCLWKELIINSLTVMCLSTPGAWCKWKWEKGIPHAFCSVKNRNSTCIPHGAVLVNSGTFPMEQSWDVPCSPQRLLDALSHSQDWSAWGYWGGKKRTGNVLIHPGILKWTLDSFWIIQRIAKPQIPNGKINYSSTLVGEKMAKPMTGSILFLFFFFLNLCPVQCLILALFYGESRTTASWKFQLLWTLVQTLVDLCIYWKSQVLWKAESIARLL